MPIFKFSIFEELNLPLRINIKNKKRYDICGLWGDAFYTGEHYIASIMTICEYLHNFKIDGKEYSENGEEIGHWSSISVYKKENELEYLYNQTRKYAEPYQFKGITRLLFSDYGGDGRLQKYSGIFIHIIEKRNESTFKIHEYEAYSRYINGRKFSKYEKGIYYNNVDGPRILVEGLIALNQKLLVSG